MIEVEDLHIGDIFIAQSTTATCTTIYEIVGAIKFGVVVQYVKHLKYSEHSKFPDSDIWSNNHFKSSSYKIKILTREQDPEYFL